MSWLHFIVQDYNSRVESRKDPHVDSWFLMGSPLPVLVIVASYTFFVLKAGPQFMKNRQPLNLKRIILFYNAYQVLFNIVLFSSFLNKQNLRLMYEVCHNTEFSKEDASTLSVVSWWYFFSKLVDLFDTVFFVLRKKQTQVTFLHLYHHIIMVFIVWAFLKFIPSEQGLFLCFLNTLVHVVMYFYYFVAALGPEYQKYIWWKKYMTRIQLIQFVVGMMYLLYSVVVDCKVPKVLTGILFFTGVTFIWLFSDFYKNTYKERKTVETVAEIDMQYSIKYKNNNTIINVKNKRG